MREQHIRDFAGFDIDFDNYGSTHSPANRELCGEFWAALRKADLVIERDVSQLYDPEAKTFLADRFVKGTCPVCKTPGSVRRQLRKVRLDLQPDRLDRSEQHAFGGDARNPERDASVRQHRETARISRRVDANRQAPAARSGQLSARAIFSAKPLRDWDVSRPAPYFGFEIPDSPGQLLVRLVRRADRLYGLDQGMVRREGRSVRELVEEYRDRGPSLHRQRHHLFPHAVLAGHAQDGRFQPADARCTSTAF